MKKPKQDIRPVLKLNLSEIDKAPWNYKDPGTDEEIQKLMNSIERDKSAGVLVVRKKADGRWESIDGNHRHEALLRLVEKGWPAEVWVEDFTGVSDAEAVLISKRRNTDWFETDIAKLSDLYRDVVLPEIPIEDLSGFMKESEEELQAVFDFNVNQKQLEAQYSNKNTEYGASDFHNIMKVTFLFSKDDFLLFNEEINKLLSILKFDTKEKVLIHLVKNYDL